MSRLELLAYIASGIAFGAAVSYLPVIDRLLSWVFRNFLPKKFKVIPHEETEWGTMFAIVEEGSTKPIHIMRYKEAHEWCAAMNQRA